MDDFTSKESFPVSYKFSRIDDCSEILKVPVSADIVQVGITSPDEFVNLSFIKQGAGIYIAREDESPLQVEVHPLTKLDGPQTRTLFDMPARDGLRLTALDPTSFGLPWDIQANESTVQDPYALKRFTREIAGHILLRQIQAKMLAVMIRDQENRLA